MNRHDGPAILLRGVRKTFGEKVAVEGMDLTIPRGAMYGFIGPNGAGKTTTLRMVMSILFADRGEIRVLGEPSALDAKDRIGYLPEERGVYKKMKVGAFLRYIGRLKGASPDGLDGRIRAWLDRLGLGDTHDKPCEELSKGMQQKVQFLATVLHEPDLLILDEPFSGLDPVNMRLVRELILEQHARGRTVLFSTHVMSQAEEICDHVVMIHDGVKVLDAPLTEVRRRHDPRRLLFEPLDPGSPRDALAAVPGVRRVEAGRGDGAWTVDLMEGADASETLRRLVAILPPARVEVDRPSLEDVFVGIVAGEAGERSHRAEDLRQAVRVEGGDP